MSREHGAYALAGEDERSRDPVPGDIMTGRTNGHYVFMMSDGGFTPRDQQEVHIRSDTLYTFLGTCRHRSGQYGLFLTPHGVYMSAMQMMRRL